MPYIGTDDLTEFYEGAQDQPELRLEVAVNQASRIREWIAPLPAPVQPSLTVTQEQADALNTATTADYSARAFDCELMLAEYIFRTQGGIVSGVSGVIGSDSFAGDEQVRKIVRQAMGKFYTGGGRMKSVGIKSSFPRSRRTSPWIGNV